MKLYNTFLLLWGIGALISFSIQLVLPLYFASITNWVPSQGWQREIAIWNIGLLYIIIVAYKNTSVELKKRICYGLIFLSFFFAVNHYASLITNGLKTGNLIAAVANNTAVILGIFVTTRKHILNT